MKRPSPLALVGGLIALVLIVAAGAYYTSSSYRLKKIPETDLFSMGQVAAAHGDYPRSVELYQALVAKDPRHTIAMDFMIDSLVKMKDWSAAKSWSEKLIQLSPDQPKYKLRLEMIEAQLNGATQASAPTTQSVTSTAQPKTNSLPISQTKPASPQQKKN